MGLQGALNDKSMKTSHGWESEKARECDGGTTGLILLYECLLVFAPLVRKILKW